MRLRMRLVSLCLALGIMAGALPVMAMAQPGDPPPTWVDAMDDPATGLLSEESPDESLYSYFYSGGQYELQAHDTAFSGDMYSYLNIGRVADTRTAVDAAIEGDRAGKYAFVGCRAGDTTNGYAFEVHFVTGDVKLWLLGEGEGVLLAETNALEFIAPGFVFNTIEIECWQNLISGAINGEVVLSEFDDTFVSGFSYVGAGVLGSAPGDITAIFDNLAVIDFNASGTGDTGGAAQPSAALQPGLDGAIAWAEQNAPTSGPFDASAEVFDGDLKSLTADVAVSNFYAELGFTIPATIPPGLWTAGFCFWVEPDGRCLEAVVGSDGTASRWFFGDVPGSGEYELLDSGEAAGLDLTPGATNLLGLYVSGQTAQLTINGSTPVAVLSLPRIGSGDVAALLSFSSEVDGDPRSYVMDTFGFAVWDLTASQTAAAAPTTVAEQPASTPSPAQASFDSTAATVMAQAPTAGPTQGMLAQSSSAFPSAAAGVTLSDLVAVVTFVNPTDVSAPWNVGMGVRYSSANLETRFIVDSTGQWFVALGGAAPHQSGSIANFNASPGGSNTIAFLAQHSTGTVAVNGVVAATLDISASNVPGDVFIGAGFLGQGIVEGRQIPYQEFTVWSLDTSAAQPAAPTPATAGAEALFSELKTLAQSQAPVAGPLVATLLQSSAVFPWTPAGVNLTDMFVSATFVNPADTSAPWDFGLSLRYTAANTDSRIIIESTGRWHLAVGGGPAIASGDVPSVATGPSALNTIEVAAQGNTGVFAVNGLVIAQIDLTGSPTAGDVFASSGFFASNVVEGRQLGLQDFSVWAIPATGSAAAQPSPTVAASLTGPGAGPYAGVLVEATDTIRFAPAGVSVVDFTMSATFVVPADQSVPFTIAVGFRHTGGNDQFRLVLSSKGTWWLSLGGNAPIIERPLTSLLTAPGSENSITLTVQGSSGTVVVNGQQLEMLDLSSWSAAGDVWLAAGMVADTTVEGRVTEYRDFVVQPL